MKNRLPLKIIICTLAVFLDTRVCLAQHSSEIAEIEEKPATQRLKAGVQFDAKARPIDPSLLPGNIFDKKLATSLLRSPGKPIQQWYKVPEWQAGSWRAEETTNIRLVLYENGKPAIEKPIGSYKTLGEVDVGLLRDKNGEVWGRYNTGYWAETEIENGMIYSYIVFQSAGEGDYPDSFSEMVNFGVSSETNKVYFVSRSKSWTRNINKAPGILREDSLRTVFDDSGAPTSTSWNMRISRCVAKFSSHEGQLVDQAKAEESFREFCHSEGIGDLLRR